MGLRFRRSIRILPGLRLNVGKRGVSSVSVGGLGAHVTVGHRQLRETVGLPGTGLSYTHVSSTHHKTAGDVSGAAIPLPHVDARPEREPLSRWRAVAAVLVFLAMVAVLVDLIREFAR